MENKIKRFLSLALALLMVFSMMPQISIGAKAADGTTLYLKPNSNWLVDSARFAVAVAPQSWSTTDWYDMTDTDGDGYYEVTIPNNNYYWVIFCRMNPSNSTNGWDTKWNQTSDLTIPTDDKICYHVDGWDKGAGQWTVLGGETEEVETVYYIRGSFNEWGTTNPMTNNGDGTYSATLSLTGGTTYQYKAADAGWGSNYPSGDNANLTLAEDAEVTFTLDINAGTLTANVQAKETEPADDDQQYYVATNMGGGSWTPDEFPMTRQDDGTWKCTFENIAASDTAWQYKITLGAWTLQTWGDVNTTSGNYEVTTTCATSTVTITFDGTAASALVVGNHTFNNGGATCDNCSEPNPDYEDLIETWDGETIANLDDLKAFRDAVNNGNTFEGKTVTLTAAIDLTDEDWTSIGNGTRSGSSYTGNAFKGTFEGNDNTIFGLNAPLFGIVEGGTVQNVNIEASINNTSADSVGAAVAVLAGGTVDSVDVSGTVTGVKAVGGVIGRILAAGKVQKCTNSATIESTSSSDAAGGIVGKAYYTSLSSTMLIDACTNNGNVTSGYCAGGIVGLSAAKVSGCGNYGAVSGGIEAGGIVGEQTNYGTAHGNTNYGNVTSNGKAGGIIGWIRYQTSETDYPKTSTIVVSQNWNMKDTTITGGTDVSGQTCAGGIVGLVYNQATITGNYNYAASITAGTFASGIATLQTTGDNLQIDGETYTVTGNTTTTRAANISASCVALAAYDNTTSVDLSDNTVPTNIVTFMVNGEKYDEVTIDDGTAVTEPTVEGYTVEGWYTDAELTTAYDFSTVLHDGITLYAKLTETEEETYPVYIGEQGYTTLQAAIDAAVDGDAIKLTANVTEDVLITQKSGVSITIDGQNNTYTGVMTVFGNGKQSDTNTLTIQNINFVAAEGATSCIVSPDKSTTNSYSYSHNVTVSGCTFTDTDGTVNCAAIRHEDGGDKNWTITGCTVDSTMHSLIQTNNVVGKLTITGCTVNSKNGINLNSCTNVEITNNTINVKGYAVRAGVSSGGNLGEEKTFVLENNTLISECEGGDAVIMLRASAVDMDLTMTKNVVSGTTHISGVTEATTISADANYWDGQSAPVVDGTAVKVSSYYEDAELTKLVEVTDVTVIDLSQGSYTITEPGTYTVNPGSQIVTSNTLTVAAEGDVTLILNGATISAPADTSAISIESGNVTIVSTGLTNTLIGGDNGAGIYVAADASVTITGDAQLNAIGNKGTDDASGAAGIGGAYGKGDSGKITIDMEDDTWVVAEGYGVWASGIGSAGGYADDITILGGTVIAQGGYYSEGGKLQTSYGSGDPEGGAAIGGGSKSGAGVGTITITDSVVEAYGGSKAAGIGAMFWNSVEAINITNSEVYAYGGSSSAGIGTSRAGDTGVSATITISGSTVEAVGGAYGAAIGSGYNASSLGNGADESALPETTITITDSTVTATGGEGSAAIGGGYKSDNADIDITGGTITATAGALVSGKTVENGGAPAAIGSGANGSGTFENDGEVTLDSTVTLDVTAYEDGKSAIAGMTNEEVEELENVTLTEVVNLANYVAKVGGDYYKTLEEAIAAAVDGDTVTLLKEYATGTATLTIDKAITLDLGGNTLTTNGTYGGLSLKGGCSLVNGTLVHAGTVTAIKAWDVAEIEDVDIIVNFKAEGKTIGGIVIQENAAGIDSIKNVTITGEGLTNGIQTYNCGNATEPVIGSMENVTINAVETGMLISAPCGTATNCSITGGTSGIEIWIKGTYSATLDLVNCTVTGGEQAVYAHDEFSSNPNIVNNGTLKLTVDDATKLVNDNGALLTLTIARAENVVMDEVIERTVAKVGDTYYESLADAAANIATDGSDTTIEILCDVEVGADIAFNYGSGDVIFTADEPVTIKQTALGTDFDFVVSQDNKIIVGENVTIEVYDNGSGMYVYYGSGLELNGTITGGQNWGVLYLYQGSHTVTETGKIGTGRIQVRGNATLTVKGEVDTNYLLIEGSTFTADGATVDAGVIYDNNNGGQRDGASTFNITNSTVTAGTVTLSYADTVLNIDVSSTLTAGTVTGSGKIVIDAADLAAGTTVKVIDQTSSTTSLEGMVEVINGTDVTVSYDDGDVTLTRTCYVAQIGDVKYETVTAAIEVAKPGETIELIADAEEATVILLDGIDLDLKGHTLTVTGHIAAFDGNNIIDTAGNGLLIVDNILLQPDNTYLPIRDDTNKGYVFTTCENFQDQATATGNSAKYVFVPALEISDCALIAKGSEASGVTMKVEVSWTRTDGTLGSATFTYTDALIKAFYESYGAKEEGEYGSAFTLILTGTEGKTLSYKVYFVSDTGVTYECN